MPSNNTDGSFKGIDRNVDAFYVWRIENFTVVTVPKDKHGNFFDGDSYLLLSINKARGNIAVHFWIGEKSSQDESGTAALKAIELDDTLGGSPVQYREMQGSESKVFLNYFKKKGGIKYMHGGIDSGFSHVDTTIKPRLLHIKGKNCPRIKEVDISWSQMNSGDSFILDIGTILFIWNGSSCSRTERIKSMEYARRIRDDRGKANLVIVEEGDEELMHDDELEIFQEYLPLGEKHKIIPSSKAGSDEVFERKSSAMLKLWKCSDADGSLKIAEVSGKPLKREMLDTMDTFIIDNGEAGIWVWCGRKASSTERREAMVNAMAFLRQRQYPSNVRVTKVPENSEPTEFKVLFHTWSLPMLPGSVQRNSNIAKNVETNFSALMMHENTQIARDTGMVDDGRGKKVVHRVERIGRTYQLKIMEKRYDNQLFAGDSYVILYQYVESGREMYIIYFWLGSKSSQDEKGVAAKKTIEMDDALHGMAKQVRVIQGKEPNHFMSMFGGRLVIYNGGKAGWTQGEVDVDGPGDHYLLHVRGQTQFNTKAEQVPLTAESLNSSDVFVLFKKSNSYIWSGKGSTGDEREMAKQLANDTSCNYKIICEGHETKEFWDAIGGEKPYSSSTILKQANEIMPPRLFQCSNASGAFTVNEIIEFSQADIVVDDVFILDAFTTIFVWIGKEARPEEKTMSMDAAIQYLETDPSSRDKDTPIFIIKQGIEPPDFIGYFGVWDRTLFSQGKTYEQLKKELGEKNISITQAEKSINNGDLSFSEVVKVPYSELIGEEIPDGCDSSQKEKHLKDDEFMKIFKMSYGDFLRLPTWKQQQTKKSLNLW